MALDDALNQRIRALLDGRPDVVEKAMFGGLAFLIGGHMAVAASVEGLLVRIEPATRDTLIAAEFVQPMEMRGRAMRGWVRVEHGGLRTKRQLQRWVDVGARCAVGLALDAAPASPV